MDQKQLQEFIQGVVPAATFSESGTWLAATVAPGELKTLLGRLKNDPATRFDFLVCQSGIDYPQAIEVVYHLRSTGLQHELVVKTRTAGRENPELDSVTDLWFGAEFLEREIYDLLGVRFTGHPDLRRIFLDDAWPGYPLRKDYVDPYNIVER